MAVLLFKMSKFIRLINFIFTNSSEHNYEKKNTTIALLSFYFTVFLFHVFQTLHPHKQRVMLQDHLYIHPGVSKVIFMK